MALTVYDPLKTPDAEQWQALDESERISLVVDYHKRMRVDLPNVQMHAIMHAIVENQVALGDATPVRHKVHQLMAQGLDRHQAIHAIASVLINHMHELLQRGASGDDANPRYYAALKRLNARNWLRLG